MWWEWRSANITLWNPLCSDSRMNNHKCESPHCWSYISVPRQESALVAGNGYLSPQQDGSFPPAIPRNPLPGPPGEIIPGFQLCLWFPITEYCSSKPCTFFPSSSHYGLQIFRTSYTSQTFGSPSYIFSCGEFPDLRKPLRDFAAACEYSNLFSEIRSGNLSLLLGCLLYTTLKTCRRHIRHWFCCGHPGGF